MTSSETSNDFSGSKPRMVLVAAISSAPSADPCEAPVFILVGAGKAITVRRQMIDGLSVTALAASMAASIPATFSPPSTVCT